MTDDLSGGTRGVPSRSESQGRQGADHRYIPLLVTAAGFSWTNAYTVASEIGDIERFASPAKLCG